MRFGIGCERERIQRGRALYDVQVPNFESDQNPGMTDGGTAKAGTGIANGADISAALTPREFLCTPAVPV